MPFTIRVVTRNKQQTEQLLLKLLPSIQVEFNRLEEKFSPFHYDSLLCQFQRGRKEHLLDSEFQEVYTAVQGFYQETDHFFNPYYDQVYNPTGFVKGWIIEKVYRSYLQDLMMHPFIEAVALNGAGDMQFDTAVTSDFIWQIGIEDPANHNRIIAKFSMKKGAVATSGMSKRGQHLVVKGERNLQQVTIIGQHLSWVDVWSTAGFSAGQQELNRLIQRERLSGLYVVDGGGIQFFREGKLE